MRRQVGAYEAKTRLPELLREVQTGRRITITSRGKPVAELGPSAAGGEPDPGAAVERFLEFRKRNAVQGRVDIRRSIDEGRD